MNVTSNASESSLGRSWWDAQGDVPKCSLLLALSGWRKVEWSAAAVLPSAGPGAFAAPGDGQRVLAPSAAAAHAILPFGTAAACLSVVEIGSGVAVAGGSPTAISKSFLPPYLSGRRVVLLAALHYPDPVSRSWSMPTFSSSCRKPHHGVSDCGGFQKCVFDSRSGLDLGGSPAAQGCMAQWPESVRLSFCSGKHGLVTQASVVALQLRSIQPNGQSQ